MSLSVVASSGVPGLDICRIIATPGAFRLGGLQLLLLLLLLLLCPAAASSSAALWLAIDVRPQPVCHGAARRGAFQASYGIQRDTAAALGRVHSLAAAAGAEAATAPV